MIHLTRRPRWYDIIALCFVALVTALAVGSLPGCASADPPAPVFGFGSVGDAQFGAADASGASVSGRPARAISGQVRRAKLKKAGLKRVMPGG